MDVTRALRTGSLILGATTLVACGGGGGSDGGDSAVALTCESPDLPVYTLEMDTQNYATQTIDIAVASDIEKTLGLYSDLDEGFTLVENVRTTVINQNPDQSGTLDCGLGGTASVTRAGSGDDVDDRWQFSECVVQTTGGGEITLSGSYRIVNKATEQTSRSQTREGFEDYAILGSTQASADPATLQQLAMKGRSAFVFKYEFDTEDGCVTESISGLEFQLGDRYVALANAETSLKSSGADTEIGIRGKLIGSAIQGYVQVTTPTAVTIREPASCPIEGVISVASTGQAEVRFGSSTGTGAAVAIEINGVAESFANCQDVGVAPLY